ncbi:MAG: phosphoribosylanthranilate isomerase [Bacteroidota bacterium]
MKVKVCGLRDNIDEVTALRPDFVGFIFYPKSKRYVGSKFAESLDLIPDSIKKVGVFVNEELEEVVSKVAEYDLDYVQLHGDESIEYCRKLVKSMNAGIIKVFSGNRLPGIEVLNAYKELIDYYLFDTRSDAYGGTGQKFDWSALKDLKLSKPIILSGGIGLEDLKSISNSGLNVFAVDVNSKFEIKPGLKDTQLIRTLIENRNEIYS